MAADALDTTHPPGVPWMMHHSKNGRAYWWHPGTDERRYCPEHNNTDELMVDESDEPVASSVLPEGGTLQLDGDSVIVIRDFLPAELAEQLLAEGPAAWEPQLDKLGTRQNDEKRMSPHTHSCDLGRNLDAGFLNLNSVSPPQALRGLL